MNLNMLFMHCKHRYVHPFYKNNCEKANENTIVYMECTPHTSMGTSSMTFSDRNMIKNTKYWKLMNSHTDVGPLVCRTFIVKHRIAALVPTEMIEISSYKLITYSTYINNQLWKCLLLSQQDLLTKIGSHVPMSWAPNGTTRLNKKIDHLKIKDQVDNKVTNQFIHIYIHTAHSKYSY